MSGRSFLLISMFFLTLLGCKKTVFYDDHCTSDCFILEGTVLDDSTGLPLPDVEVTYQVPNKLVYVVTTHSDTAGHYRLSFDANFTDKCDRGRLNFRKPGFISKNLEAPLFDADINVEKHLDEQLFPAGNVLLIVTVTNKKIDRLKIEYLGDEIEERYEAVSETLPDVVSVGLPVPANRPNTISLFGEKKNLLLVDWQLHLDFPEVRSPDIGQTDTIYATF